MAAACCGEMRSGSSGVNGPTCGRGIVVSGGDCAAEPAEQPAATTSSAAAATIEDPLRTASTVLRGGQTLRAALSKRVYWPRQTRRLVPIGPERCLAMITSADPLSGDSALYTSSR